MPPFLSTACRVLFAVLPLGLIAQPSQTPASPSVTPPTEVIPPGLFTLPEGLEITLWAEPPLLRNPTNMDIDAQGRIWVTEGVNYRSERTREPEGDRVMVIEDSTGDGRADRSWTFVREPMLIAPLGIAVIDNQIIVSSAPDMIVYTDVDRDGKYDPRVDKRDVLLTGFHGYNHDHSLHSVTFGPDGRWYFNQGNAGALFTDRSGRTFRVGSAYNFRQSVPMYGWNSPDIAGAKSDDGHVYVGGFAARMNPDGTNVEIIGHNFRNSYEQTITSFGDVFQNDNDDPLAARTAFLMEYGNTGFASNDGQRTWDADRRPGQDTPTAQWRQDDPGIMPAGDVYGGGAPTGIVYYEGDALGPKWRGLLLSADAGRNTILGYLPKPDGAGYALENFIFLTSNKEQEFAGSDFINAVSPATGADRRTHFRPSDVAVGPDGAIYVADWYDSRVGGHGANDTALLGAIYRIAPKGFKSVIPQFDLETVEGQITALKSPAVNVRALGYTRLRDRGPAAIGPVSALLQDENPYIRARAVWLLVELGPEGVARVEEQLRSEDPKLRIVAYRALRRIDHRVLHHARTLATDPSPAVRREVALSLRDMPFAASRDLLLTLARGYDGQDRSYLEAWGTGATGKEEQLYAALASQAPAVPADQWPAAHANLVWRLTPSGAVNDFITRARSERLTQAERLAAVTALGFIPTRESAMALMDFAQNQQGEVKNHGLWWLLNYKDSRWAEHNLDGLLKERGIYDPDNLVIVESTVPEPGPSQLPPVEEIQLLRGDAARGAVSGQACLLCHRVGGQGIDYGPDLTGWASRQTTESVIKSIIDPSAEIALGYQGSEVRLADGGVVHGRVLATRNPVIVQSTGGLMQFIPADRLVTGRGRIVPLRRSLMLSADQLGLSAQDVADIAAWLKTQ